MTKADPAPRARCVAHRPEVNGVRVETPAACRPALRDWLGSDETVRQAALAGLSDACAPIERTPSEQAFLAGPAPACADYIVLQWARTSSSRDVPGDHTTLPAPRDWRSRMVALPGDPGDRFLAIPSLKAASMAA